MSERITFYGPVQGMVRVNNFVPIGGAESTDLAKAIKKDGCKDCPRLGNTCQGVNWVGLESGYLYQSQGQAVHASGSEKCPLIGKSVNVSESLVKRK